MDASRSSARPLPAFRAWPVALAALGGYFAWLAFAYWDTLESMVSIWYRSQTFAHGFVVVPIALWLVWRKRGELAALEPSPSLSPIPLIALVLAGAAWLVGEVADVLAIRHFAWMTMLVAGVWTLTGSEVTRRIAFPLAYLYFAVPVGEFLLPTLIQWTTDFTVAALRLSGVPVLREGSVLQIPSGNWSIVEACSGLRYLIASLTVGTLYAYLSYRSLSRRAAFILASVLVPLVANWLRAYLIIMLGHLSNNRLAVGVDHIIYGWLFFGVVILLLFWVGSFWREDDTPAGALSRAIGEKRLPGASRIVPRSAVVLAVAVFATGLAPYGEALLLRAGEAPAGVATVAPPFADWRPVPGRSLDFTPEFLTPRSAIASDYARGTNRAALYVAMYFDQDRDSKLVSSENQILRTTDKRGYVVAQRERALDADGKPLAVTESLLRLGAVRVVARSWFWIDGEYVASPVRAKLLQAWSRLRGRGDAGAIVVVFAPVAADADAPPAFFDDFTRDAAAALRPLLAERLLAGASR